MEYFKEFWSNTLAGSGNQYFFLNDKELEIRKGRLFYKIFKGGKYRYSLLFSNIVDSTYSTGSVSHKNMVCGSWYIAGAALGICNECSCTEMPEVGDLIPLTFGGKADKNVQPGEFFNADAVELEIADGQYLCVEISFRGKMIPYHEESQIPAFVYQEGHWIPSKLMPFPGMIGCSRPVAGRIAFLGDSITQGIGVEPNSYEHWNARVAEKLGAEYACWNLGLGYGRADDAASDGAWLFKAKQSDVVVICLGINDIVNGGFTEEQIKESLSVIVKKLTVRGIRILIQTLPPFEFPEAAQIKIWENVNDYIRSTLAKDCDAVFDIAPLLAKNQAYPYLPAYGGHPDSEGCAIWAEALYPVLKKLLQE